MSTLLIVLAILIYLAINIFIIVRLVRKSYYFTKRQASIIKVAMNRAKGTLPSQETVDILHELNKKKHN